MTGTKLEVITVTKSFAGTRRNAVTALERISLSVRDNEIVCIIGPSGCGKSTLLDIVAGLTSPDDGQILLDGKLITGKKGFAGYMPQKDVLFPWRTVLDNVIVGLEVQGVKKREARVEAERLLPVFGLESFGDCYPSELSGGMRQRASFLRTYLCKRELMLLDEPFGKLDAITRLQMQRWLLDIWENFRHAVLFVTHDVDEAILLSDRIYVMSPRPGQIMAELDVGFARPRETGITGHEMFIRLKNKILNLLGENETGREVSNV